MDTVIYNNIEIKPVENQPFSYAYMDGKPLGRVELDGATGWCSFDVFCYNIDEGPYENAAHFIWTLYNTHKWDGILDINLDTVTKGRRMVWRAEKASALR